MIQISTFTIYNLLANLVSLFRYYIYTFWPTVRRTKLIFFITGQHKLLLKFKSECFSDLRKVHMWITVALSLKTRISPRGTETWKWFIRAQGRIGKEISLNFCKGNPKQKKWVWYFTPWWILVVYTPFKVEKNLLFS